MEKAVGLKYRGAGYYKVTGESNIALNTTIYISDILKDINIRIVINNTNVKCITFYPVLWS